MDCKWIWVVIGLLFVGPVCVQAAAAQRPAVALGVEKVSLVGSRRASGQTTRIANRSPSSAEASAGKAGEARFSEPPVPLQAAISKRLGQERSGYAAQQQRTVAGLLPRVRFANVAHGLRAAHDGQRLLVEAGESCAWGLSRPRLGCRAVGAEETRWQRVGRATTQRLEVNQVEWERCAGRARVREAGAERPRGIAAKVYAGGGARGLQSGGGRSGGGAGCSWDR